MFIGYLKILRIKTSFSVDYTIIGTYYTIFNTNYVNIICISEIIINFKIAVINYVKHY